MSDYEASPFEWVADHVEKYESSGGTEGLEFNGFHCVVLSTVGRRTGKLRKSPLIRVHDGDKYVAIASMGGQPTHPVWYLNLVDNPEVTLQDGADVFELRARPTDGDEHAALRKVATAVYPEYDSYQARCERLIPAVALEPR